MKNILIISEIEDYMNANHSHYSFSKGFNFGYGLSIIEGNHIFYYTVGKSETIKNIQLVNDLYIDDKFIEDLNVIILIRETNLIEVFDLPFMKKILENKKLRASKKIFIKCDSLSWMNNKEYAKKYGKRTHFLNYILWVFNGICCQTDMLKNEGINLLKPLCKSTTLKLLTQKIIISRMGVPNQNPLLESTENPYSVNHDYCVNDIKYLGPNKALFPCVINENFNKEKIKIIYMGRVRFDDGRIFYFMRDLVKLLGDDYELHIFPGRFNIPGNSEIFSPKNGNSLLLLRDTIFNESTNVIIHYPFGDNDKQKYLEHIDLGIDFSQGRPYDKVIAAGNAKLLEYCYYGVKVVGEKNINNSYLVENAKNGILLQGIASVEKYADSIKELHNRQIDKNLAILTTIENHNWELIAREFYYDNIV